MKVRQRFLKTTTAVATTLLAGLLIIAGQASPAAAWDWAPLQCGQGTLDPSDQYIALDFCIASSGGRLSSGIHNSDHGYTVNFNEVGEGPARVELSYYAFDQWPNGGNYVITYSATIGTLAPQASLTNPYVAHWYPGIYCVRLYWPNVHHWWDAVCYSTGSGLVQGTPLH